jgi:hypothetical protein
LRAAKAITATDRMRACWRAASNNPNRFAYRQPLQRARI